MELSVYFCKHVNHTTVKENGVPCSIWPEVGKFVVKCYVHLTQKVWVQ